MGFYPFLCNQSIFTFRLWRCFLRQYLFHPCVVSGCHFFHLGSLSLSSLTPQHTQLHTPRLGPPSTCRQEMGHTRAHTHTCQKKKRTDQKRGRKLGERQNSGGPEKGVDIREIAKQVGIKWIEGRGRGFWVVAWKASSSSLQLVCLATQVLGDCAQLGYHFQ